MMDWETAKKNRILLAQMTFKLIMSALRLEGENKKNLILEERASLLIHDVLGLPLLDTMQRINARDPWEVCVGLWDVPVRDTDNPVSSFKDYPDRPLHFRKGSIRMIFDD